MCLSHLMSRSLSNGPAWVWKLLFEWNIVALEVFLTMFQMRKHANCQINCPNRECFLMSDWKLFLLSPDGKPMELGFQCTVCGNMYKIFSSLKRHMKKHDSEPQHVCPVCYKTFYNKWEMTRHLNRTHEYQDTWTWHGHKEYRLFSKSWLIGVVIVLFYCTCLVFMFILMFLYNFLFLLKLHLRIPK